MIEQNACFFDKKENFLEKHNEIWEKVSKNIKTEFINAHNKKYIKTEIKLYKGKSTQKKVLNVFVY